MKNQTLILLWTSLSLACLGQRNDPDLAFCRAENAMFMGRWDWARKYYAEDLNHRPGRLESMRNLGIAWASGYEGSFSEAIEAFKRYLDLLPDDRDIQLRLASALIQKGHWDEAIDILGGLESDERSTILMTKAMLRSGSEEAGSWVKKALAANQTSYDVQLMAAEYFLKEQDFPLAENYATHAIAANPLQPRPFFLRSQARRRLNNTSDSQRDLVHFHKLRTVHDLSKTGRLSLWEEWRALSEIDDPELVENDLFLTRLCKLLWSTGQIDAGQKLLDELRQRNALTNHDLLEIAADADRLGAYATTAILLDQIAEQGADYRLVCFARAKTYLRQMKFDVAQQLIEKGLTEYRTHAPFFAIQGVLQLRKNDIAGATHSYQQAIRFAPWQTGYRTALADIYLSQGDRQAFDRLLQEAPGEDPRLLEYIKRHSGGAPA